MHDMATETQVHILRQPAMRVEDRPRHQKGSGSLTLPLLSLRYIAVHLHKSGSFFSRTVTKSVHTFKSCFNNTTYKQGGRGPNDEFVKPNAASG